MILKLLKLKKDKTKIKKINQEWLFKKFNYWIGKNLSINNFKFLIKKNQKFLRKKFKLKSQNKI